MLKYILLFLVALGACAQAQTGIPFQFRGSTGAAQHLLKNYSRGGDLLGFDWKCQDSPPIAVSDTDRAVCYCDAGANLLFCSFNGSAYDYILTATQIPSLVTGAYTMSIPSNGVSLAATGQLVTPTFPINKYRVACNDPDGCNVLAPVTDPTEGTIVILIGVPTQGPLRFFVDADDQFLGRDWVAGSPFTTLTLIIHDGDWVEMARSYNNDEEGSFKTISVVDNGSGTPADFEITTGYPYFNVSCADTDGCTLVAVNTEIASAMDQFTVIAGGLHDVFLPDISNEIEVTGASITLTPTQTVSFIYNSNNWQQYTPVLP